MIRSRCCLPASQLVIHPHQATALPVGLGSPKGFRTSVVIGSLPLIGLYQFPSTLISQWPSRWRTSSSSRMWPSPSPQQERPLILYWRLNHCDRGALGSTPGGGEASAEGASPNAAQIKTQVVRFDMVSTYLMRRVRLTGAVYHSGSSGTTRCFLHERSSSERSMVFSSSS